MGCKFENVTFADYKLKTIYMTKEEEIIKILKNYTTSYKCLNAVPEDRIIIEDHFEEIAELIAKVISLNPPVIKSVFCACIEPKYDTTSNSLKPFCNECGKCIEQKTVL